VHLSKKILHQITSCLTIQSCSPGTPSAPGRLYSLLELSQRLTAFDGFAGGGQDGLDGSGGVGGDVDAAHLFIRQIVRLWFCALEPGGGSGCRDWMVETGCGNEAGVRPSSPSITSTFTTYFFPIYGQS